MKPLQIYRLVVGLLILGGISMLYIEGILNTPGYLENPANTFNFFSFFTIQGNLIIAVWFLGAAFFPNSRWATGNTKGALLEWGTITTLVYWSLLWANLIGRPWYGLVATSIVHAGCSLFPLIEILRSTPATRIEVKHTLTWLAFPLAWAAYTFIRAAFTGWYPYWFINPEKVGGIVPVVLIVAGFVLFYFLVGLAVLGLIHHRQKLQG